MTETKAKRSGCLTAFIIVLIVLYALGALGSFVAAPLLSGLMVDSADNTTYSMINGALSLLSIVFLIGVWKYKKWGFYGFTAAAIISIIISIMSTGSILISLISGLIFPVILYFLIRPIWNYMS